MPTVDVGSVRMLWFITKMLVYCVPRHPCAKVLGSDVSVWMSLVMFAKIKVC